MTNGGPENKALYVTRADQANRLVVIPDEQDSSFQVDTLQVPDAGTIITAGFQKQPVTIGGRVISPRDYCRIGVFSGPIPEESDPKREEFYARAREIAAKGQAVLKRDLGPRITQMYRDE